MSDIDGVLICQICDKVLENPKMLGSCEHVFCFTCIESNIITETHCPFDHKRVDSTHVEDPPKYILDFLAALRIRCDFHEFGCQEVISLPRLLLHRLNCQFHPERRVKCSDCGLETERARLSDHNCVSVLKNRLENLELRMEEVLRSHFKEIASLKCLMSGRNLNQSVIGKGVERQMVSFSCISDSEPVSPQILFIQTDRLTLQCEASVVTKVDQIKYNASLIAGLTTTEFSLFCNGVKLEDHKQVSQYSFRSGTICHLLPNRVFIAFDCTDIRRIVGFSVRTEDTIADIILQLKAEIRKLIPEQLFLYLTQCSCSLFLNESKLEETYTLANYDVFAIKRLRYCT